ncbi:hypothetical protein HPC49_50510 [Pyxidicoccus fallax]|uniref:Lipoprotein n=1 Tax=Pyxidicoccus fallax TaxID=394095 RepID=A0A848LU10_9BACT|nr:hypothetical protein [Pyxidicoccus fallax]NMO20973.1 hypothetical protein [Pyxidicoccus fallax]NPC86408.1 hypothetical protein [Pyxidicoccus fallax]
MRWVVLGSLLFVGGCATSRADLDVRVREDANGLARYEGALAGPYDDVDELAEAGCERMVGLGASLGYCAVFFSAPDDEGRDRWFIGHVADLTGGRRGEDRTCTLPIDLVEPSGVEVLSLQGRREGPAWRPTRFLNQRTGATWARDVLVFSLEGSGKCTVYGFVGFSRVVTVSHGDGFRPVATVYDERGAMQVLAGSEWLP